MISLHYGYARFPSSLDQGFSYGFSRDGAKHRFEADPHCRDIVFAICHRPMFQQQLCNLMHRIDTAGSAVLSHDKGDSWKWS
ncbi:hypothetical protein GA0061103_3955 [Rhizobium multihospitium]|uniref:Uncharacterized protein n=1 Tax=Rhizobium multihospitium TaxID=410764 RepID=A0A1C3VKS6_9HYPH|nr:hypothetical protein GA0061103_3955 [Rhizobium multihospitium]